MNENLRGIFQQEKNTHETLRECVARNLDNYLSNVEQHQINDLYNMVLKEVEGPMLQVVMKHARSNQSKASEMLGLNRGTLRKKLKHYDLLD